MGEKWNRSQRRQMKKGVTQEQWEAQMREIREEAVRNAWGGMMLALHKDFGFGYGRLHKLAIATMRNINSSLCPSVMIEELKAATGFDVDEPLNEDELGFEFNDTEDAP